MGTNSRNRRAERKAKSERRWNPPPDPRQKKSPSRAGDEPFDSRHRGMIEPSARGLRIPRR